MVNSPAWEEKEFDVQEVKEYADQIFEYMLWTEKLFLPKQGYMSI